MQKSIGNDTLIVVKVGGSSITDKASFETLNRGALQWFVQAIASSLHERFKTLSSTSDTENGNASFIIIHGAGSFGHHIAKEYGLKGQEEKPDSINSLSDASVIKRRMTGLAKTRSSVKKLNSAVVEMFLDAGINCVGISPCMNIPQLQAHGGNEQGGVDILVSSIQAALDANLIPVIHGDAGLYGKNDAGILGGDTLVEIVATHKSWEKKISKTIFLTDVNGVYSEDPKRCPNAKLVNNIVVDSASGKIISKNYNASASTHTHDVTGGLATKLKAAVKVVKVGINVNICKCCSEDAERALKGINMEGGTIIELIQNSK